MVHRPKPIPMALFQAYLDKDVPDRREMFKLLLPELVQKYAVFGLYPVLSKGLVRLVLRPKPHGSSTGATLSVAAGSAEQKIFKMPGPEILQAVWPHLVRESANHGLIPVISNGRVGFVPRSAPHGSSFGGLVAYPRSGKSSEPSPVSESFSVSSSLK